MAEEEIKSIVASSKIVVFSGDGEFCAFEDIICILYCFLNRMPVLCPGYRCIKGGRKRSYRNKGNHHNFIVIYKYINYIIY